MHPRPQAKRFVVGCLWASVGMTESLRQYYFVLQYGDALGQKIIKKRGWAFHLFVEMNLICSQMLGLNKEHLGHATCTGIDHLTSFMEISQCCPIMPAAAPLGPPQICSVGLCVKNQLGQSPILWLRTSIFGQPIIQRLCCSTVFWHGTFYFVAKEVGNTVLYYKMYCPRPPGKLQRRFTFGFAR